MDLAAGYGLLVKKKVLGARKLRARAVMDEYAGVYYL